MIMAGIILLLLIPIFQIGGVIDERHIRHTSVIKEIAESSSTEQLILGPILIQPYTQTVQVWKINPTTGKKEQEDKLISGELQLLPSSLKINANLKNETRTRGIYQAHLYHADTRLKGSFSLSKNLGIDDIKGYEFHKPFVVLSVTDMRGIESAVTFSLDGKSYEVKPGPNHTVFDQGVHAVTDALDLNGNVNLAFEITMTLQGTGSINVVPIGKETSVDIQSGWAHPSFSGQYLPVNREISEDGFSAHWKTSYFSTNVPTLAKRCFERESCDDLYNTQFGVNFIDPVNLYVKTDRAVKYALLFILLTFVGVFLFEILKKLRVHPVQYSLVGLAIAIFYLLLMSLAEHMKFSIAYAISALACVSLISSYVGIVLKSTLRGLGFGSGLILLYALLYGILSSEDYALLAGSLLSFGVLTAVMLLTGKMDWYQFGETGDDKIER